MLGGAYGRRVVVVAGKGSNGADGRVAAGVLARRGARVSVVEASSRPRRCRRCDLVIDGAYGTGFRGTYEAPDVPEGAGCWPSTSPRGSTPTRGEAGPGAVRADRTVTFAAAKPGLLQGGGPALLRPGRGGRHRHRVPEPTAGHGHGGRRHRGAPAPPGPRREQVGARGRGRCRLTGHGGFRHPVHAGRHGGRRRDDPPRFARRPDGGLAHRGGAHAPAGHGVGGCLLGGDDQVQGGRAGAGARHVRRGGRGDPGGDRRRARPARDRRGRTDGTQPERRGAGAVGEAERPEHPDPPRR